MADTGCQSCLASVKVIRRLGLCESDLIAVTMQMHAVNNNGIKILRFSGRSPSGKTLESRQIVYVTSDSDKLFLSRETCAALGMITKNFRTVGETLHTCSVTEPDTACNATETPPSASDTYAPESTTSSQCTCPRRSAPPPKPTEIPFSATENSRMRLQQWLLDYYRTRTFNTCEHQPLPLMESVPMRLMVDPNAEPIAHNTPIPVPHHWQEDVKAGLDHDVSLGVPELVPNEEPVTWCHRMVVSAKKNGKPRRTVDFQALKLHSTRETHHTHALYPVTSKRLSLIAGMDTTASPYMWAIATSPHSSPHGVDTATRQHPRVTSHLAMVTREGLMRLSPTSLTKQSALTTPSFGQMTLIRASSRLSIG